MDTTTVKRWGRTAEELLQRGLASAGATQSEARISTDSQAYWGSPGSQTWRSNSHWRDAKPFVDNGLWRRMGEQHLALFDRGARAVGFSRPWDRVVDWGCGGGANAVHFAPRAGELVGVDISEDTVRECGAQVAAVCDTPHRPITVDVATPETALDEIGPGTCDVFLCCYVLELAPSPEYGARLLRIARDLLAPGGAALMQIKYSDGRWRARPRRRAYRSGLAEMTTYPIHEFWQLAQGCGLTPETVELVPKNELDERYAYFFLSKQ